MKSAFCILSLLAVCVGLMACSNDPTREGYKPIALPYAIEQDPPFKVVLSKEPNGIQVTVYCTKPGEIQKLALYSKAKKISHNIQLPRKITCEQKEISVMQGILFDNTDAIEGQDLDVSLSGLFGTAGSLTTYALGYSLRADQNRNLYFQQP